LCLLSCFIHVTRSFPGLLGTLSAYFSIIYPWSNVNEDVEIDTSGTIMYHGLEQDTYTLWSNKQCTRFVQETNLMQFFHPSSTGEGIPHMVPTNADLASQICYGLEFSMGAQCSTWISTLFMFATVLYVLTHNSPDPKRDGFNCVIHTRFAKASTNDSRRNKNNTRSTMSQKNKQTKTIIHDDEEDNEITVHLLHSSSKDNQGNTDYA